MVLGPKKLPGAAQQIGRWVGRARSMARQFREQLELEVSSVDKALDTNTVHKPPETPASSPASTPQTAPSTPAPQPAPAAAQSRVDPGYYPPFDESPMPVSQPHPEANMVVRPLPQREPQAELPFGEAPSAPGGASHSKSD